MKEFSPSAEESEANDEPEVTTPRHNPDAVARSQTTAIYRILGDLKKEGHLAKRRLHLDLLTERLAERFSFSNDDAQKIISVRAGAVLELMDEEDAPGFKWSRYVIHRELTHAASKSAPLPRALLTPLNTTADESSEDEYFGRTQKSVLRPKVTTVSNKVTGKRNRNTSSDQPAPGSNDQDEQEDTDEMEDIADLDTPSKVRGHDFIRDPFSATKPRTRSFLSASSGAGSSLMKSLFKDKLQTPSVSSSVTRQILSSPEPDPSPTFDASQSVEEPQPDLAGPWACRVPGCKTVFSMADGDERRQLIGNHAGEHDWETQMKIELMEQEKRMHSTLPVDHLMQYVLDQHVQTMRAAFPDFYSRPKENGTTKSQNGLEGEKSILETEQPGLEFNEEDQDQDDEDDELDDLEHLANGDS